MCRTTRLCSAALALASILGAGCGGGMGMGMGSSDDGRLERVYSELRNTQDSYHASTVKTTDPNALRSGTFHYSEDMYALLSDMIDVCESMMGGGMMGDHEGTHIRGIAGEMLTAVDGHYGQMNDLVQIGAMHAECEEHHESMSQMLDEVGSEMPHGGMMGN